MLITLRPWQGGPILLPVATASKAHAGDADEATDLDNADNTLNMMDIPEVPEVAELETAGATSAAADSELKQISVMNFERYFRQV